MGAASARGGHLVKESLYWPSPLLPPLLPLQQLLLLLPACCCWLKGCMAMPNAAEAMMASVRRVQSDSTSTSAAADAAAAVEHHHHDRHPQWVSGRKGIRLIGERAGGYCWRRTHSLPWRWPGGSCGGCGVCQWWNMASTVLTVVSCTRRLLASEKAAVAAAR